jgi:hypothetical protein
VPFDLELSIDENPPEIETCGNLTTAQELQFLLAEAGRRGLPLTHIAPNFGVEKGTDYRCSDGLAGLEERIGQFHSILLDAGIMPDFHSGDDLSSETRRVIGRATKGRNHFKISPSLQELYAFTLHETDPPAFRTWWEATRRHVEGQAAGGSSFASECLKDYERAGRPDPAPDQPLFHYYHFAPIGERDDEGRFKLRELFYTRSEEFYREYARRTEAFLLEVAADVFPA